MKKFAAMMILAVMMVSAACAETVPETNTAFLNTLKTEIGAPEFSTVKAAPAAAKPVAENPLGLLTTLTDQMPLKGFITEEFRMFKVEAFQTENLAKPVGLEILNSADLKAIGDGLLEKEMKIELTGFEKPEMISQP